jgi:hypothetical protein
MLSGCAIDSGRARKDGWISLFNGKNLEGWTVKITGYELGDNYGSTFRVEDGILKVSYDQYNKFDGKFGHLFYEEEFSHYRMRLEYRFVGEQTRGGPGWAFRNSGVMIHGQPPESMRKDQDSEATAPTNERPATSARPVRTWLWTASLSHNTAFHPAPRLITATNGSQWKSKSTATRLSSTS